VVCGPRAREKPPGSLQTQAGPTAAGPHPETKVCPDCAEEVKWAAPVCRFCRYEFAPPGKLFSSAAQEPVGAVTP